MKINPVNFTQYKQKQQKQRDYNIPVAKYNKNSKEVAFTGNPFKSFVRLFDSINPNVTPLERLQHLAEEAQNHHSPLGNAIHRGDFKGKVSKGEIIEILKSEQIKAKFMGDKKRYQKLIDHVDKTL